jgi:hypothetical protein
VEACLQSLAAGGPNGGSGQAAEDHVSKKTGVPNNNGPGQKQYKNPAPKSGMRRPDFVAQEWYGDSKDVETLHDSSQLRDTAKIAKPERQEVRRLHPGVDGQEAGGIRPERALQTGVEGQGGHHRLPAGMT